MDKKLLVTDKGGVALADYWHPPLRTVHNIQLTVQMFRMGGADRPAGPPRGGASRHTSAPSGGVSIDFSYGKSWS